MSSAGGVRIADMPDLGPVSDTASFVGEQAGSGRFSAVALRDYTIAGLSGGFAVTSWNGRSGDVTLTAADITTALTYVPYAITNPSGFQTAAQVAAALPVASSSLPTMDGSAAAGVGITWSRADHIHPSDTSRYPVTNPLGYQTATQLNAAIAAATYTLPTASTTLLGGVKVDGTSVTIASGVISATAGGGIPDAPSNGNTYGRNNAAWVTVPTGGAGIADAPNDATTYARKSLAWSHLAHTDITDWAATLAPYAPLASPTFTGSPSLPTGTFGVTQAPGTSGTTIATTAFVTAATASYLLLTGGAVTGSLYVNNNVGISYDSNNFFKFFWTGSTPKIFVDNTDQGTIALQSWVTAGLAPYAPLASPSFTGTPLAPTATAGTNTTQIATTAYVTAALAITTAALNALTTRVAYIEANFIKPD